MSEPASDPVRYRAFISYSHKDSQVARWLHRAIESYSVPKALVGRQTPYGAVPRNLRPVFRDEDELAGAAELGPKLEEALAASAALIVICSPTAARSVWVDREIRRFKQVNPHRPVLAVIVRGEPQSEEECFPEALRMSLDAQGEFVLDPASEPLAPDLQKQDRLNVKLKLIAGLLGVGYDDLVRRDLRRTRRLIAISSSAGLAVIVALTGLSVAALGYAKLAEQQRNAAQHARQVAEHNAEEAERRAWLANIAAQEIRRQADLLAKDGTQPAAELPLTPMQQDRARPTLADTPLVMRAGAWADYAMVDSGGGRKLERYGPYRVVRPEPQCLWTPRDAADWNGADAVFDPSGEEDDGRWRLGAGVEQTFPLAWRDVRFLGRFTPFRHLGFFPEQAANWAWLDQAVRAAGQPPRVLNLFGYTGVASLVCAAAGAAVTHVDASKKAIGWARENAELSGLSDRPIRWICEDARRYARREARRGSRYEGIILDPPKYGRGPGGEVWRLFEDLPELVRVCVELLADGARFLLLNAYAERLSGVSLACLLGEAAAGRGGRIEWGELALVEEAGDRGVGVSFFARWVPR